MKISQIITPENLTYGAPMGRPNIGTEPMTRISGKSGKIFKCHQIKVYEKRVHLIDGYDAGGAYWGSPSNLYVRFTRDLTFIQFYRR